MLAWSESGWCGHVLRREKARENQDALRVQRPAELRLALDVDDRARPDAHPRRDAIWAFAKGEFADLDHGEPVHLAHALALGVDFRIVSSEDVLLQARAQGDSPGRCVGRWRAGHPRAPTTDRPPRWAAQGAASSMYVGPARRDLAESLPEWSASRELSSIRRAEAATVHGLKPLWPCPACDNWANNRSSGRRAGHAVSKSPHLARTRRSRSGASSPVVYPALADEDHLEVERIGIFPFKGSYSSSGSSHSPNFGFRKADAEF